MSRPKLPSVPQEWSSVWGSHPAARVRIRYAEEKEVYKTYLARYEFPGFASHEVKGIDLAEIDKLEKEQVTGKGREIAFTEQFVKKRPDISSSTRYRPTPLAHVHVAIEESQGVLDLGRNWDGEDSPAVAKETWERATRFLKTHMMWLDREWATTVESPDILPGPDGSIDIDWETETFELLVNIPSDPKEPASFYGDEYGRLAIKGTFDPEQINHSLLAWLAKTT